MITMPCLILQKALKNLRKVAYIVQDTQSKCRIDDLLRAAHKQYFKSCDTDVRVLHYDTLRVQNSGIRSLEKWTIRSYGTVCLCDP